MSTHELVYFNGAGRAEATRIMLHVAKGNDWTDTRIVGKDFPELKKTYPLGSLPILKVDGVTYVQSTAMLRYAGKLAGWYPEDPLDALMVDSAMDTLNEMMSKAPRNPGNADEFQKLRQEFQADTMTKVSNYLEAAIQRAGGGAGLVKGGKLTVADILVQSTVQSIQSGNWDHIDSKFYDAYPGILATAKAVQENEQVKAYYASLGE